MKNKIFFLFLLLFLPNTLAFAGQPQVFFSDMTDGKISGWEGSSSKGAAVSIWGVNFGTTRGTSYVTIGGVQLTNDSDYAEWGATTNPTTARGLQRITFFLKSSMSLGSTTISVTTSDGSSRTIPFYCRTNGNIYFVSRTGNDLNDGRTLATPWFSFKKAREVASAGDVVYFRSGIWTEIDSAYPVGDPNYNWDDAVLTLRTNTTTSNHKNGTANNSITFASYPGEVAQMADGTNVYDAYGHPLKAHKSIFRHSNGDIDYLNYWTFSKFKGVAYKYVFNWTNNNTAKEDHLRVIGWDMTTTSATTGVGMGMAINNDKDYVYIYGNYIHHIGKANETDPHGYKVEPIYIMGFGSPDHVDIGWNEMAHNNGTLQVYGHLSTDRLNNLYIHDNYIIDSGTTGIVLNGGDGVNNYSFVQNAWVYNNIITRCVSSAMKAGDSSTGSHGGNFYIYNNVFASNATNKIDGEIYTPGYNALTVWKNNIFYATTSVVYFSPSAGDYSSHTGSHNCFYGRGNGPTFVTDSINDDPQFINDTPITFNDFTLKETSPMITSGTDETLGIASHDFYGFLRSTNPTIGAFSNYTYQTPSITIKSIKVQ
jgi:hypothetical protein